MNTLKSLYSKLIILLMVLCMFSCDVNLGSIPPVARDMSIPADLSPTIMCNDKGLIPQSDGTYIDTVNGGCRCIPDNMKNKNQCRYCLPLADVIKVATIRIDNSEYVMYRDGGCLEPIVAALYDDKFCGFTAEPPGSVRYYLFTGIEMRPVAFYVKSGGTCVLAGFTENSLKDQRQVPITMFLEVS